MRELSSTVALVRLDNQALVFMMHHKKHPLGNLLRLFPKRLLWIIHNKAVN